MKLDRVLLICTLVLLSFFNINFECAYGQTLTAPGNSSFKAYMSFKAIGSSTKQGQLQKYALTDGNGLRTVNGRYCIAVGSYYSRNVGELLDVHLSTGTTLHCIVGDMKADRHTDATHRQSNTGNGNVVEFIVDTRTLNPTARRSGTVSSIPGFEGDVIAIDKVGMYNNDEITVAQSDTPIFKPLEIKASNANTEITEDMLASVTEAIQNNDTAETVEVVASKPSAYDVSQAVTASTPKVGIDYANVAQNGFNLSSLDNVRDAQQRILSSSYVDIGDTKETEETEATNTNQTEPMELDALLEALRVMPGNVITIPE